MPAGDTAQLDHRSLVTALAVIKPLAKYDDLLTVDDMAEVLKETPRNVYRQVEKNELPHIRVGKRIYFPRIALIETFHLNGSGKLADVLDLDGSEK